MSDSQFVLPAFWPFFGMSKDNNTLVPCFFKDDTLHNASFPRGDFIPCKVFLSEKSQENPPLEIASFIKGWKVTELQGKIYVLHRGEALPKDVAMFWVTTHYLFADGFLDRFVSLCVPQEQWHRYLYSNGDGASLEEMACFFKNFFSKKAFYGDEANMVFDPSGGGIFLLRYPGREEGFPVEILALLNNTVNGKHSKIDLGDLTPIFAAANRFLCTFFGIKIESTPS